jgi:sugar lactone lactonase YvrE
MIKAFDFKIDKKDYIRAMALSNDGKLLYVAFAWNNNIRVFNVKFNKEESKSS